MTGQTDPAARCCSQTDEMGYFNFGQQQHFPNLIFNMCGLTDTPAVFSGLFLDQTADTLPTNQKLSYPVMTNERPVYIDRMWGCGPVLDCNN